MGRFDLRILWSMSRCLWRFWEMTHLCRFPDRIWREGRSNPWCRQSRSRCYFSLSINYVWAITYRTNQSYFNHWWFCYCPELYRFKYCRSHWWSQDTFEYLNWSPHFLALQIRLFWWIDENSQVQEKILNEVAHFWRPSRMENRWGLIDRRSCHEWCRRCIVSADLISHHVRIDCCPMIHLITLLLN